MASPHLQITEVADTEQKAPAVNEAVALLDRALNQVVIIDVSAGGQIVVTDTQAKQNMLLRLTGTPAGAFEIVMPADQRLFAVHNQVTSGQTATIGVAVTAGSWDTVVAGEKAFFHTDGENTTKIGTTALSTPTGLVEQISGMIEVPEEKTYTLVQKAPFAFNINELAAKTIAGSMDVSIQIDGTPVTGIDGVTYNTSESTNSASGANAVAVDQTVTMVVTNLDTDTAEDFSFTMKTTRT